MEFEPDRGESESAILIVESSRTQLELARHLLDELGYATECAQNALEAKERLDRAPIDCIVASWELPDQSGIDLTRELQLHPQHRWIPVIILTAHLDRERIRTALAAGATDFLRKPIDSLELEARLIAALRTRSLYRQLHSLATRDPLTGLLNRRAFMERFELEMTRAIRYRKPISIGMVDLDHFKQINDVRGHHAGDRVLSELARIWLESARSSDIIARYGGEEFSVVLPETAPDGALESLERLRARLEAHPFEVDGHTFHVTLSAGLAGITPGAKATCEELLRSADRALYDAKEGGRNRVSRGTC